jgi:hypothetical protein
MQASAHALAKEWARNYEYFRTKEKDSRHDDFIKKQENIFWEGLPKEDTIKPRVEECINNIENICRPIIDNKSLLFLIIHSNNFKKFRDMMANKVNSYKTKRRLDE